MLEPTSEKTAQIYKPIKFEETDRLAISVSESGSFLVNIYGVRITKEEYDLHSRRKHNYTTRWNQETQEYEYFAYPSYAAQYDFVKRIPERRKIEDRTNYRGERWEFAATDITVSIIYKLWMENSEEKLVAFDEEAKVLFQYLLASSVRMSENAKVISQYKAVKEELDRAKENNSDPEKIEELESKLIPANAHNLQFCDERPLSPYQQVALYLQNINDGFASFMEQGTGKTPPSIANIDNLALQKQDAGGKILKALIVCPNNVRANWENEFKNFSTVEGRVTIVRGTEMNRIKSFFEAFLNLTDEKYTVVVIGYDTLYRFPILFDFPQFPDGDTKWDLTVCDESHYFKDNRTKRWEKGLLKVRDRSKRRYVLTGTPVCNNINDLWTQLEFLRKGGSGFVNFKNFADFYSNYDEYTRTTSYQNLPFIQERLAMMSFFISKKEALPDLPEKVYDIVEVEMSSKQTLVYEKIATELQYKIEQEIAAAGGTPDAMTVNNILTQLLRLAQITSGFVTYDAVYDDSGNIIKPKRVERFAEQPKIDATLQILSERKKGEKTIIWACFESDILALAEAIKKAGYKYVLFYGDTSEAQRKEAEHLINYDDEYTVFIGNAAAGGTGLNLLGYPPQHPEESECNVTQEIFFSQNWSMVYRSQAEDRAHRRGTRTNIRIIDLQVANTIDCEIRNRVVDKRKMAKEISDIKDVLTNIITNLRLIK